MKKQLGNQPKKNKKAIASSVRLALESRLLFDGAVVATATEVLDDKTSGQEKSGAEENQVWTKEAQAAAISDFGTDNEILDQAAFATVDNYDPQPNAIWASLSTGDNAAPNLIVVDSRASGLQQLLENPPQDSQIKVLDLDGDGYQQIAEILEGRAQTNQLQILTGQQDGKVWLGSSTITSNVSLNQSLYLADWGNHLTKESQIQFIGTENTTGDSWLNNVHALTGGQVQWLQNQDFDTVKPVATELISLWSAEGASLLPSADNPYHVLDIAQLATESHIVQTSTDIVFIDPTVSDVTTLIKDVAQNRQVILLDPTKDGVDQMAAVLAQMTGVTSIHILSHGSEANLYIGTSDFNADNMQTRYADDLQVIKHSLADNADILIYGCNFASGLKGDDAAHQLAAITGANIAASTDVTGAENLGGDWVLEESVGKITAPSISATNWQGVLANITTTPVTAGAAGGMTLANAIKGFGITIVNATYSGGTSQAGTFTGASAITPNWLAYDSGIMFSTGDLAEVNGPNTNAGQSVSATGGVGDTQFSTLVGGGATSYDASSVSITFVPTASKVTLQFTFGSEEYNKWVYSSYNDAMAVWVNGVLASVTPDNQYISVNTVNQAATYTSSGSNVSAAPSLYIDNTVNTGKFQTAMNGFTKTLTLVANVTPGVNNTIKIGVSDIADHIYDSYLFVGANSLQCEAIANTDIAGTPVNTPVTIDALANDTDYSGHTLKITGATDTTLTAGGAGVTLVTGATVALNSAGKLVYTPATGYTGKDLFTYTIDDGNGTSAVGYVQVTVDAPPVAANDTFTTPHDVAVTFDVRANDTDPRSEAMTVTAINGTTITAGGAAVAVTGGTVNLNAAGNLVFTPTASYVGTPSFTYTITDVSGFTVTATVNGTVTNIAPVIDLNSAATANPVLGATFGTTAQAGPTAGWTEGAATSAGAIVLNSTDGRWDWTTAPGATATLTQAIALPTLGSIDKISFDIAWQNDDNNNANTLTVSYNGVVYATFTTLQAGTANASGLVGTWVYSNGASGPASTSSVANEATGALTNVTITLPAGVTASGNLVFTYGDGVGSGTAHDDIAIDNVIIAVTQNDYNWEASYTQNGTPVSISDTDRSITDTDANMVSASILLTNPQAGDMLLVAGSSAATGSINGINYVNTGTAITLSGTATKANYESTISAITFANVTTGAAKSGVIRDISVTTNDGIVNSNMAHSYIYVVDPLDSTINTYGGSITTVPQTTSGNQSPPKIVVLGDKRIMYIWSNDALSDQTTTMTVFGRIFNPDGTASTAEFQIGTNHIDGSDEYDWDNLDASLLADGKVVVGWVRANIDAGGDEPIFTILDPSKTPGTAGFTVIADVEMQQNDTTIYESPPVITALSDGRFLGVWSKDGFNSSGSTLLVEGRIFNADGSAATNEFQISTIAVEGSDAYDVNNLVVKQLTGGNVVVAFERATEFGDDTPIFSIINPSITPGNAGFAVAADKLIVQNDTTTYESPPAIKALKDGRFMAVWVKDGPWDDIPTMKIMGRIFNANGTAATDDFQIGTQAVDGSDGIDIDTFNITQLDNNRVLVGLVSSYSAGSQTNPYFNIIDPNLTPGSTGFVVASDVKINSQSTVNGNTIGPPVIVAMPDGSGKFIAVWQNGNFDNSGNLIYRLYDGLGTPLSNETTIATGNSQVSSADGFDWGNIQIAAIDKDSFTVGWVSVNDGGGTGALSSIINLNYPPVDGNETNVVQSNGTLIVADNAVGDLLLNATDPNNDTPLTVSAFSIAGQTAPFTIGSAYTIAGVGVLTLNANGSYSFTATSGYVGTVPVITYTVSDGHGGTDASTLTLTVQAPPTIDLAYSPVTSDNITNGVLTGTTGWTASGNDTSFTTTAVFDGDNATMSLTQTGLTGLNVGPGANGAATVSFDLAWNNGIPAAGSVSSVMTVTVGGVVYAKIDTGTSATATATITYLNGASGNIASISESTYGTPGWVYKNIVIDLPGNVSATGSLVFKVVASNGTADDFSLDNVKVLKSQDQVAGTGYTTSYTENGAPVAISTQTAIQDSDSTNMASATITLSNPQTGDRLLVNGSSAASGTLASGITWTRTDSLVTLGGSFTKQQYAAAIQQIQFENTTDTPPTVARTINVQVNDGAYNSNVAVATINVIAVNDAPVAVNDSDSATEAGGTANGTAGVNPTGNVLTNDTDVDTVATAFTVTAIRTGATEGAGTAGTVASALTGAYGSLTLNPNGSYTYVVNNTTAAVQALNVGQTLTDSFNYTMSDGSLTDIAVLTITINGVNDAPVAVDDTVSATEAGGTANGTVGVNPTGNVLTNDTDVDTAAAAFTVTAIRTGATEGAGTAGAVASALTGVYGSLTLNANGSYTYVVDNTTAAVQALNVGQTLTDSFNYTMSDGSLTDIAVLTITIKGANDAPVALDDTVSATEAGGTANGTAGVNPTGNVLANDTDVDTAAAAFTVTAIRTGATEGAGTAGTIGSALVGSYGSLTLSANGGYSYVVNNSNAAVQALKAGQTLTESYNYTIKDGGLIDIAVLTITINGTNDAPTTTVITGLKTNEDTALSIPVSTVLASATDIENDTLTITSVQSATNGTVALDGLGNIVFTPSPDYNGPASFTYTISDGNGGTITTTVNLTVNAVNDTPVNTVPASYSLDEDTFVSLAGLQISDVDAGTGSMTVKLSVPSGFGTIATAATSSITVTGSGTNVVFLTGTLTSINTFLAGANALVYTPASNDNGLVTLTMNTNDNGNTGIDPGLTGALTNEQDSDTIAINIAAINDAPTLTVPATLSTPEDTALIITGITFADVDATNHSVSVSFDIPVGSGGSLVWLAQPGVGKDPSSTATYVVLNGQISAIKTAIANGNLSFVPIADYNTNVAGPITLTTTVNDKGNSGSGGPLSSSATSSISITAVADIVADAYTVNEDSILVFNPISGAVSNGTGGSADNFESAAPQITQINNTAIAPGGSVTLAGQGIVSLGTGVNSNQITFTPDANFKGAVSQLKYTVISGGVIEIATIDINVVSVNDAPDGVDNTISTLEDAPVTLTAADFGFTDVNDNPANVLKAVVISSIPASGSLTLNGVAVSNGDSISAVDIASGLLIWTPATDSTGTGLSSFSFQVQDDGGTANGGVDLDPTANTITFDVTSVNDAPDGVDNTISTLEDAPVTLTAADFGFADSNDTPANALSAVLITSIPSSGSLTLNGVAVSNGDSISAVDIAAGKLVWTPAADSTGTGLSSFSFQVQDDGGTANGGVDLDPTANTITFDVTSVNDAPDGKDNTISTLEDAPVTLTAADFGFTDVNDNPANVLKAVVISSIPASGSLTLNGVAVSNGDSISAVDIASGLLIWTPATDSNGTGLTSFSFQVQDDGGTANGGVDLDPTANTITFDVTSVNDAPDGKDNTISTLEDAPVTLTAADFGFTDVNDNPANVLKAVVISSIPASGSLTLNGVAVSNGDSISAVDIAAGKLVWTPAADSTGTGLSSFSFQVQDDGGTANGGVDLDPTANTITFDVTSVNDAPDGKDNTISTLEDDPVTLTAADFGFTDVNDNPANVLKAVVISSIPASGSLTLNGVAVSNGDSISAVDIASGLLIWTPASNSTGTGLSSFSFQVQDDGGTANGGVDLDPIANTITFDATSVNDAPDGKDNTISTLEDAPVTLTAADFGFTDVNDNPANVLKAVVISSIPASGSLTLNGVAVSNGDSISAVDIASGLLIWTPATDSNGTGLTSFSFQVQDDGGTANGGVDFDPTANIITFDVTSVNDAPDGKDNTISTLEDAPVTLTAADFGFTDVNDNPTNVLKAVVISSIPASGSLTLNGVAVSNGDSISAVDIASGLLIWTPATDSNGTGLTSFSFQVQDDGGTANGGVDLDPIANTITFNVTSVNDAPDGKDNTISTLEDAPVTLTAADFGFTDVNDNPANVLKAVVISSIPASGSLTLNGVAVSNGDSISAVDIASGLLIWTPATDSNGTGLTSFSFQVQDDGGTANGGVDLDPKANTITFDVTSVNDAPDGVDNTISTLEDAPVTLTAADFGFTDVNDNPANALSAVLITSIPSSGSLTLNGTAVIAGASITAADIAAGKLIWTPASNSTGLSSFSFQVQDDGGTANGGVDLDPKANTITFDVTSVNDAPDGKDNTISTLEDAPVTLTAADFGFTDVNDNPANLLKAVVISSIPASGSLTLNGVAVSNGDSISAVDIAAGKLVWTPASNSTGTGLSSFSFQVQDDGGTANGGVDLDPKANTITFDVTSVNDAPDGKDNTISTLEDAPVTLTAADFGFTDVNDNPANALSAVLITSIPSSGSLTLNGTAVIAGASITAADIAAGKLVWTPASNSTGTGLSSFSFQVQDDGGTANGGVDLDPTANTITFDVTSVNDAPDGVDNTISTLEDAPVTLTAADFGFADSNDTPANALSAVLITSIPSSGSLTLNGTAVIAGASITAADIAAGKLVWTPATDSTGTGLSSFSFQVQDDGGTANGGVDLDPTANIITFDVTSVNDAPDGKDNTISTLEDAPVTLTAADFGFTDVNDNPANVLKAVVISSIPASGSLTLNGVAVSNGDSISAVDIASGLLIWTPATDSNGTGLTSFSFQVQDDGGTANGGVDLDPKANTITFDVTSVNDAPDGVDNTISTLEDAPVTLTAADFGFTDVNDNPANVLKAVVISSIPASGSLTLNGVAVSNGDSISAVDIAAGKLVWTPAADSTGTGLSSFSFQVQDDGGTANGGVDLDPTANTITFDVTSVNDAPDGKDNTISTLEDDPVTLTAADFGFTDVNDNPANVLKAVVISSIPASGSLTLNGVAVSNGDSISAVDIASGLLIWTPASNSTGTGLSSFSFQVQDDGGTANGGVDLDPIANTITFDATSVNDAPDGKDNTISTLEDAPVTLTAADFGFTDVNDNPANVLKAVVISSIPASGSLTLNGVAVSNGDSISAVDIASGLLIWTPATDSNGTGLTSFSFQVQDDGGTANGGVDLDPTANTITFDVTSVNDAPDGKDNTISTLEDAPVTLTAADFGFTDVNDNPANLLKAVVISSIPASGSLTLNGVAVSNGDSISAVDIAAGKLVWTPATDSTGTGLSSFSFQVQDDGGTANGGVDLDPKANTITFDVTSVNDAPDGKDNTISTLEDAPVTLTAADFGFTDVNDNPANALSAVLITSIPSSGSLTLNGTAVIAGASITAADIAAGKLVWTPASNSTGTGLSSFSFQVQDDGGTANGGVDLDPTANTITFDVTSVNDAPDGVDNTISTLEDAPVTLTAADFGFTDVNDNPANVLKAVVISSIPASGSLTLNGVAVSNGDSISAVDIAAGKLVWTPATDSTGTGLSSFSFQVQDDGGTANGGVDLDPIANTITFDATSVNDAPDGKDNTISTLEDDPVTLTAADFGFTDVNDNPANVLKAVVISSIPASGSLTLNGVAVSNGDSISAVDIASGLLIWTPASNSTGTGLSSFSFQVQDDGGTANGGVDLDPIANTITFDATSVNDAPDGKDNTISTLEDAPVTLTAADFGFTDVNDNPANVLKAVVISSIPASGSLTLNGVAVSNGDSISAVDIASGLLIWTPATDSNGTGLTSFSFQVQDDGGTANGGVDLDPTANTITFDVTSVNDAPDGKDNTISTLEDAPVTLTAADFGFTDVNDNPANLLKAVVISSIPASGSLTLNGVAVSNGDSISAVDIASGLLIWTPASNSTGTGLSSFSFQVQDDGGTANGGVDLDPIANTITFDATSVNDAPDGKDNTISTLEDAPVTLTAADFGFTDVNDNPANVLKAVVISSIPASGSLTLNGVAVSNGDSISAVDIASGLLIWTPATDSNGTGLTSFSFQVQDDGGTANGGVDLDPTANTITFDVTSVNDAPDGKDNTISTLEDAPVTLTAADFGFTDVNDNPANLLKAVVISSIPASGSLTLNGVAVSNGDSISAVDIAAGKLVWTPATDSTGTGLSSFSFQVQDDGGTANGGVDLDPIANTITFDVTSVNDAPDGKDNTISTLEDAPVTLTAADFGFTDSNDTPANTLSAVLITSIPSSGSLTLNGTAVIAGASITAADIAAGKLVWTPAADSTGTGLSSFSFQVQDDGGTANGGVDLDPIANTITFNVTSVNDAPDGVDNTISTLEDAPVTLTAADFGFTDVNDNPANLLKAVVISSIPASGSLTLNGVAVSNGDSISAVDIASGLLIWTPATDSNGTGLTSFSFQVQDDGGTANGGVDLDPKANTITFNVTSVNDAPDGVDNTISTLEDAPVTLTAADFGFTDVNDNPANVLKAVVISSIPASGSLTLNGVAVSNGDSISAVDIAAGKLVWTPATDSTGTGLSSFSFQVQDDGGTANGGVDLDPKANTITFDVTSVNDAPEGKDKTVTIDEDTIYTITAADFGFTDLNDNPANNFVSLLIINLPISTEGVYQLNGVDITEGQVINVTDLNAGLLTFTPVLNLNRLNADGDVGSLGFKVQDDGGVDNTDPSIKTLQFDIKPMSDLITISGLTDGVVIGTDAQVDESHLSSGTHPSGNGEFTSSTFVIKPIDSIISISINGSIAISKAQLLASDVTPIDIISTLGTLTITGYDQTTGAVSYNYLLSQPADHSAGVANDEFAIKVLDADTNYATAILAINIIDDAPIANADVDEAINYAGNPSSTATGNVFTGTGGIDPNLTDGVADIIGADGTDKPVTAVIGGTGTPLTVNVGSVVAGDFGQLTLNSDGSYIYVPDYANASVASLIPGATLTDIFTYQISDKDGDAATTTLTITIVANPAIIGLHDGTVAGTDNSVLESDLSIGTNPVATGETCTGSFELANLTGVTSFTIEANTLSLAQLQNLTSVPFSLTTAYGQLRLTGFNEVTAQISYEYTLLNSPTTAANISDDFKLSFVDGFGNDTSKGVAQYLKIAIFDDAPVALSDNNTVTENTSTAITGNVFSNDLIGADGASSINNPVTDVIAGTGIPSGNIGTALTGQYGNITLNSDGGYSYSVDNSNPTVNALQIGETLTDTFTYTITDKDGDTATTTLVITINGANDAPVVTDQTTLMSEDGTPVNLTLLASGTDVDGDTLVVSHINNVPIIPGTEQHIAVIGGVVDVSPSGLMTFTPNPDFNGTVTIPFETSDGHGGTATANQIINVTASPDIVADELTTDVNTPISYNPIKGTNGATTDSFVNATVAITAINGAPIVIGDVINVAHGTVSLGADNVLSFTPELNFTGTTTYSYTVSAGNVTETALNTVFIQPQISINDVSVDESAGTATFTVTLSTTSTKAILVDYATSSGVAQQDADFTGTAGHLSFTPGETSLTITVNITDDAVFEGSETFKLVLSNAVNATIADELGIATIQDNDTPPKIASVSSPSTSEGGNLDFVITLSNPSATPTTVTLTPANGSTTLGVDTAPLEVSFDGGISFVPLLGNTVDVPAGVVTFITRIPTRTDQLIEGNETLSLSAGTAENTSPMVSTGTIVDNTHLAISIDDATPVDEGYALVYSVRLNGSSDTDITVPVTYTGTANDGNDFVSVAFVTIPAGTSTGKLIIPTKTDTILEGVENVVVKLGDPVGAANVTVADAVATGLINDITSLTVSIADAPSVLEGGQLVYSVSLSGTSVTDITLPVTYTGLASDGSDYTSVAFVTIPAGSTSATLTVPTLKDLTVEGTEAVQVTLGSPSNPAVVVVKADAVGYIKDQNATPVANIDQFTATSTSGAITGNVLSNDKDPNADALTVTQFSIPGLGAFSAGETVTIPEVGRLVIYENGAFSFMPNANYQGKIPSVIYTISDGIDTSTGQLMLSIATNNTGNIGALILLSNPTSEGLVPVTGNQYGLSAFKEPIYPKHFEEDSHPAELRLIGDIRDYDLYLTGVLKNQVVIEERSYTFYVPLGTFRHSNPNEQLNYEATGADGAPLPGWLKFDPKLLQFSGVPPKASHNMEVMIKASDRYGHKAYATFKVTVHKDVARIRDEHINSKPSVLKDKVIHKPASKVSFNDQVGKMGKLSRLMESRALLDSLNDLGKPRG